MQPGLLLFGLYSETKDSRYKILLDRIIESPEASPKTGCSGEHWGRALGWYVVALAEIIEMLPDNNEFKQDFTYA